MAAAGAAAASATAAAAGRGGEGRAARNRSGPRRRRRREGGGGRRMRQAIPWTGRRRGRCYQAWGPARLPRPRTSAGGAGRGGVGSGGGGAERGGRSGTHTPIRVGTMMVMMVVVVVAAAAAAAEAASSPPALSWCAVQARQGTAGKPRKKNVFCQARTTHPRAGPPLPTLVLYNKQNTIHNRRVTSHESRPYTNGRERHTRRTARGRDGRRLTTPTVTRRGGRDGPTRATPSGRRGAPHPLPRVRRLAPDRGPSRRRPAVHRPVTAPVRRLARTEPAVTSPPPPLPLWQFTKQWTRPPRSGRPWRLASRPTPIGP